MPEKKFGFLSTEKVIYFSLLTVLLIGFFSFTTNFEGPDMPIYYAYTRSVVEDRDLNPVRYIDERYPYVFPDGTYGVSPTYNLPTQHNHGGIVLWVPFYVYARALHFFDRILGLNFYSSYTWEELTLCALSFSTVVFGVIALFLSFLIARAFFSNYISLIASVIVFFGTPIFFFTFYEVGNANVIAMLFLTLTIWYFRYVAAAEKEHWFLFGVFLGIAMVVKVDVWFLPFFIGCVFLWLLYQKRTDWKKGLFFLFGVLPPMVLKTINDYIKYGRLHMGEFGVINLRDSYFLEQMFSRYHGFFYTSPLLYICMAGVAVAGWNVLKSRESPERKNRDLMILFLGGLLVFKLVITSLRFAWGLGTPGARILVTELTVFVILLGVVISYFKHRRIRAVLILTSIICVLWNFLVITEYMTDIVFEYILNPVPLSLRVVNILYIFQVFMLRDLDMKLRLMLPLLIVFGYLSHILLTRVKKTEFNFWNNKDLRSGKPLRIFTYLTLFFFASYTLFTVLNVVNNRSNVEALLEKGNLGNDYQYYMLKPDEYEKAENLTAMISLIYIFYLKGDTERVSAIEDHIYDIYGEWGMDFYRYYYGNLFAYKSGFRREGMRRLQYLLSKIPGY